MWRRISSTTAAPCDLWVFGRCGIAGWGRALPLPVRPVPVVFGGAGNAGVEVEHAAGLGGERDEVASVFVLHEGCRGIRPWQGEALPTGVRAPFCMNISLNDSDHAAYPSPAVIRTSSTTPSMRQPWPTAGLRSRRRPARRQATALVLGLTVSTERGSSILMDDVIGETSGTIRSSARLTAMTGTGSSSARLSGSTLPGLENFTQSIC